ncbi:MAG: HAD-IA family hydrolase [Actinomycetota bacterium]
MDVKALLFDFDGLIVDTETPEFTVWRETYEAHGHSLPIHTWAACIGTIGGFDPVADLQRLTDGHIHDEILERMVARSGALLDAEGLRPGIAALLAEADAAGIPRAIVSSSDQEWIGQNLGRLGAADGWAAIICAEGNVARAKPRPTMYLEALGVLGVAAQDALAFEDSPNGIAAAQAAGIRCIAVPNSVTVSLDLGSADHVLPTLDGFSLGVLDHIAGL